MIYFLCYCLDPEVPLCVCVGVRLNIYCRSVSPRSLCSCATWFLAMYNAYPKFRVLRLSVPPPSWHSNAQALALECFIWPHIRPISARFMTSGVGLLHQIPRQDTIHGRCECVTASLFLNLRGAAVHACQGSCKKNPYMFSAAHLLFIPFCIHKLKN